MTKSEEINQILHQNIKLVFKDAINYKELIQSLLEWNEKQLLLHNVSQQRELLEHFCDCNEPLPEQKTKTVCCKCNNTLKDW